MAADMSERERLARTLYGLARGRGFAGQWGDQLVASVNRAGDLLRSPAPAPEPAQETQRLRDALINTEREVTQTLGKALGYPWYKDDPKNFLNATEADGVCVGDHVAATLALEAADRIRRPVPEPAPQAVGWRLILPRRTEPMTDDLVRGMAKALEEAEQSPLMINCPRCKGAGYHHGFGEHGHDPDWCDESGGPGKIEDPLHRARQALSYIRTWMLEPQQVERLARTLIGGAVASDEHWPETVTHYHEMCAKYPDYAEGRSLVTDAFRNARAALSSILTTTGG